MPGSSWFTGCGRLARGMLWLAVAATGLQVRAHERYLHGYHHSAWTSDKGLGSVFDVQQDPEGYLWLNTSKGIFRFDGVRFEPVDEVTGGAARNRDLDSAFVSRNGGIWFSTQRKGMLLWKDQRITAFPDRRCTPGTKTEGVVEDRDGSLWIRASAGLSHLRNGVCEQASAKSGYPGGYPKATFIDSRGTLWVVMQSGVILFRAAGRSEFQRLPEDTGVPSEFSVVHESPSGAVWISDHAGIRKLTDDRGVPSGLRPARIAPGRRSVFGDFVFTSDGSVWAATSSGLLRFDASTVARGEMLPAQAEAFTVEQGLSSDVVWKVAVDREGTVWTGTNAGLDQLRRSPLSTIRLPKSEKRSYQFAVDAGDGGSIWIGSRGVPLTNVTDRGEILPVPQTHQAISVRRDAAGTIWSSGWGASGKAQLWRVPNAAGTASARKVTAEEIAYPAGEHEVAAAVAVDRNQEIWISTFAPNVYHRSGGKWSRMNDVLGRKPGVIGTMRGDEAGNVWFAFSNKVVKWDGKDFHRFSFPDGQMSLSVTTLAFRDDRVWLGGLGGVVLLQQGQFRRMEWREEQLPGPVTGIVETREGDLWLNGFGGILHVPAAELSRWLKDASHPVSAERLDAQDGLPGLATERWPEPSLVESAEGRLWFATSSGVAWLDPADLKRNRNLLPPPVEISSAIADGKSMPANAPLSFAPHTRNLQFVYTALSLAVPERVRFRYFLEGADETWHEAGTRREAFYNNLQPGRYRFRVVACNNDGVWNSSGASIEFGVEPALYQTVWFQSLVACIAIACCWLLGRLRIRTIQRRIEERFAERLEERERIARELHDTLLQSVFGLMLQFQRAVDAVKDDSHTRGKLEQAIDHAEAVMREGRGRLRGLRGADLHHADFPEELAAVARQYESLSSARFRLSVYGTSRPLHAAVHEEAVMLVREALANAFTHSNASMVQLEIEYQRSALRITIKDDGRGIDDTVLNAGRKEDHWGLPGMRERAARMGGTLTITCPLQAGTRILLLVPGRVAYERDSNLLWRLIPAAFRRAVQTEQVSTGNPSKG